MNYPALVTHVTTLIVAMATMVMATMVVVSSSVPLDCHRVITVSSDHLAKTGISGVTVLVLRWFLFAKYDSC